MQITCSHFSPTKRLHNLVGRIYHPFVIRHVKRKWKGHTRGEGKLHFHSQQLIMHEYPIYLQLQQQKAYFVLFFESLAPRRRRTKSSVKHNLDIINYIFRSS